MGKVNTTTYKDQLAIAVENDSLRFLFLPDTGASLASILIKSSGRELLVQRPESNYRRVPFGGLYVDAECSGMDDMFPTIDACHYECFPWQGTILADHGEVWNLPFVWHESKTGASFTTHGVRLPYRFNKEASFLDESTLRIAYLAENNSPFDMDFLWAAHFMLCAEPGVELILPESCTTAQAVFSNTGSIGAYGQEFSYPHFTDASGYVRDMSRMGIQDGSSEKFYFRDPLKIGFVQVHYQDGLTLEISFPEEQVPYLGILYNQGGFQDMYNLFVEPCTAPFDRPDVARLMGKHSIIPARSHYCWHLDICIDQAQ